MELRLPLETENGTPKTDAPASLRVLLLYHRGPRETKEDLFVPVASEREKSD